MAAIWAGHPLHSAAKEWLLRARSSEVAGSICQHSLLEIYASLTGMPAKPKLSPSAVHAALAEAVRTLKTIELSELDYVATLQRADRNGLSGGVVYDLLILHAAEKAGVDRLVTANGRDFLRLWHGDPSFIHPLN